MMQPDTRRHVLESHAKGEFTIKFQGAKRGQEVTVSMEIEAKRFDGVWDMRITLGDGNRFSKQVQDDEFVSTIEYLHASFSKLGTEVPRA